ncbi:S-adenosyl-L-methionine-dependent methyltransferase [Neofusicoccum parvum]|nr:S-adenosyl-L-methionine-dependent methyltransferase [Neofusicoccum parvum]
MEASSGSPSETLSGGREGLRHEQWHEEERLVGETLVVDDDDEFDDSTYEDEDSGSYETSLASSATDFKYELGRRYHAFKDGKYHLPNDEREISRLELQHRIWYLTLNGRLFLSPLSLSPPSTPTHHPSTSPPTSTTTFHPQTFEVLDIGTGAGNWAIDFASAHPNAQVTGTDLSPIQPNNVPGNCSFIVDDATEEWAFGKQFDFVHARMMGMAFRDWPKFFASAWAALKPGGWIELQEWTAPFRSDDRSLPPDCAFSRWNSGEAAAKAGIDVSVPSRFPQLLAAAGFVEVTDVQTKWPLGPWSKGRKEKRLGDLFLDDMIEALPAASLRLYTRVLGWEEERVMAFLEEVKRDMLDPSIHAYMPVHICYAQKPLDAES